MPVAGHFLRHTMYSPDPTSHTPIPLHQVAAESSLGGVRRKAAAEQDGEENDPVEETRRAEEERKAKREARAAAAAAKLGYGAGAGASSTRPSAASSKVGGCLSARGRKGLCQECG